MNDSINDQYEEAGINLELVDDNEARTLLMQYNRGLLSAEDIRKKMQNILEDLGAKAEHDNGQFYGK